MKSMARSWISRFPDLAVEAVSQQALARSLSNLTTLNPQAKHSVLWLVGSLLIVLSSPRISPRYKPSLCLYFQANMIFRRISRSVLGNLGGPSLQNTTTSHGMSGSHVYTCCL